MTISLDNAIKRGVIRGYKKAKEIKDESWGQLFKDNLVEATGILIPSIPFFTAFETLIPKYLGAVEPLVSQYLAFPELIPVDSIDARIKTVGAMYLGLGLVFSKLRDVSRATFDIEVNPSEAIKKFHDGLYAAAVGIPAAWLLYYSNGDLSNLEVWQGVVSSTIASLAFGSVKCLGIDYSRNLLQNKKSVRIPKYISNMSKNAKYATVALAAAASFTLTAGVYEVKDNIDSKKEIKREEIRSRFIGYETYDATSDFYCPVNY